MATDRTRHRLPRVLAVGVAVCVLAAGCGAERVAPTSSSDGAADGSSSEPLQPDPGWEPLPDGPLTARHDPHGFWSGSEMLILGGADTPRCPPAASCVSPERPPRSDGAAFDPHTSTWRALAHAPVPLGSVSGALLDETLYLLVPGGEGAPRAADPVFLAYDVAADRWTELPAPTGPEPESLRVVAAADRVLAVRSSQERGILPDLAFDPATSTWSELPVDPLAPSFDRTVVWTGTEAVLLGLELVSNPGSERPSLYRAAALDLGTGRWRLLPASEIVSGDPRWHWVADRVVNPSLGTADGGEVNNWGRTYPTGGMLDPESGRWSALPDAPERLGGLTGTSVGGGDYVVSPDGAALDMVTERWWTLERPPRAPDEGAASVWAGERLIVWGGVRWVGNGLLLDDGWAWLPPR